MKNISKKNKVLKGKVEEIIYDGIKKILSKKKMTMQTFIEDSAKRFMLDNIELLSPKDNNKKKK